MTNARFDYPMMIGQIVVIELGICVGLMLSWLMQNRM